MRDVEIDRSRSTDARQGGVARRSQVLHDQTGERRAFTGPPRPNAWARTPDRNYLCVWPLTFSEQIWHSIAVSHVPIGLNFGSYPILTPTESDHILRCDQSRGGVSFMRSTASHNPSGGVLETPIFSEFRKVRKDRSYRSAYSHEIWHTRSVGEDGL